MYQNDQVHTFIKASFQRVLQLIMPFCIRVGVIYIENICLLCFANRKASTKSCQTTKRFKTKSRKNLLTFYV